MGFTDGVSAALTHSMETGYFGNVYDATRCRIGGWAKMRKSSLADIVFMIGGFIFAPSLIVSIVKGADIPLFTSLPTAIVLTAFTLCYLTLKLRLAAFATALTAVCWYILVFGRVF